jgi:hypothetical protein
MNTWLNNVDLERVAVRKYRAFTITTKISISQIYIFVDIMIKFALREVLYTYTLI